MPSQWIPQLLELIGRHYSYLAANPETDNRGDKAGFTVVDLLPALAQYIHERHGEHRDALYRCLTHLISPANASATRWNGLSGMAFGCLQRLLLAGRKEPVDPSVFVQILIPLMASLLDTSSPPETVIPDTKKKQTSKQAALPGKGSSADGGVGSESRVQLLLRCISLITRLVLQNIHTQAKQSDDNVHKDNVQEDKRADDQDDERADEDAQEDHRAGDEDVWYVKGEAFRRGMWHGLLQALTPLLRSHPEEAVRESVHQALLNLLQVIHAMTHGPRLITFVHRKSSLLGTGDILVKNHLDPAINTPSALAGSGGMVSSMMVREEPWFTRLLENREEEGGGEVMPEEVVKSFRLGTLPPISTLIDSQPQTVDIDADDQFINSTTERLQPDVNTTMEQLQSNVFNHEQPIEEHQTNISVKEKEQEDHEPFSQNNPVDAYHTVSGDIEDDPHNEVGIGGGEDKEEYDPFAPTDEFNPSLDWTATSSPANQEIGPDDNNALDQANVSANSNVDKVKNVNSAAVDSKHEPSSGIFYA